MKAVRFPAVVVLALFFATTAGHRLTNADTVQTTTSPLAERQFLIECTISTPKGGKTAPVQHPYMIVTENQEAKLVLGQTPVQLPGTGEVNGIDNGLSFRFRIIGVKQDEVQLDSTVTVSDLRSADNKKVSVMSRSSRTIEIVKLQASIHREMEGASPSVDLKITPVK